MKLEWGRWKGLAAAGLARLGRAAFGATVGLLGLALAAQAWRARGETEDLRRQAAAANREAEDLARRNRALREELRALETDPVYVESLLRRWKMAAKGERVVD